MAGSSGSAKQRIVRDKKRSAVLKAAGIERTTGRCPVCYAIHSIEGPKSRYKHKCRE